MSMNLRDKIAGSVYGFAIGDAMGATTEFMNSFQIKLKYGKVRNIIGGGWLNLNPGEVTDDTQMTICVMDAIMKLPDSGDEFAKYCGENFVKWLKTSPKDVGNQCSKGIHKIASGEILPVDDRALGNGSLMRAMPLALLDLPYYNILQGCLTHNNKLCSDIILDYTRLIQEYLNGNYNNLYTKRIKGLLDPSGYIVNTFNNSVYWSCKNSFKEAMLGAVNHGGDADTIAAITGSLAGAKFGMTDIPQRWIGRLDDKTKSFLDKFIVFVFECMQI